jgi:hypothetical protein
MCFSASPNIEQRMMILKTGQKDQQSLFLPLIYTDPYLKTYKIRGNLRLIRDNPRSDY